MSEDNGLLVGKVYETIIDKKVVVKALYLGRSSDRVPGKHVIVFRKDGEIKCRRFNPTTIRDGKEVPNYSIEDKRLTIRFNLRYSPYDTEIQYLDERLSREGL